MRLTSIALLAATSLLSSAAMASGTVHFSDVDLTCSQDLSINDTGGFVVGCVGDLQVQGNGANPLLSHGTSITLRATSSLTLKDLRVVAPSILLEAPRIDVAVGTVLDTPLGAPNGEIKLNTNVRWDPDARIDPNRIAFGNGGALSVSPGAQIQVAGESGSDIRLALSAAPVPEPSTWALLLAGLGLTAFTRRRA